MFSCNDHLQHIEKFEYSHTQYELLTQVRELGSTLIGPHAKEVDREGEFPFASLDGLRRAGMNSLTVPTVYGGYGAGYKGDVLMLPIVLMELASWCSSTSQVFALHNSGVQFLHSMGSEEQKEFFFQQVLEGYRFGSFGSEGNTNTSELSSTVRQVDGGYVLNGRKIFATGSLGAKWAIWRSVSVDKEGSQEERFMLPIVDLTTEGITVVDDWDGIGQRGTGSGTVIANDVFIPVGHLLGNANSYFSKLAFFDSQFHIHFAAQYVGIAMGAYRETLQYLKEKKAEGDPIIQLRVGDMAAKLASAQQLVIRAARLLQAYEDQPELRQAIAAAASHAKIVATEVTLDVTSSVFQVMGARSATRSRDLDMYYRNARTLTLHDPVDNRRQSSGRYELGI